MKPAALLLALVMVLALFAGCGSDTGAQDSGNSATDSGTPEQSATPSQGSPEPSDEPEPVDYKPGQYPCQLPIVDEPMTFTLYAYDRPFMWGHIDDYNENLVQQVAAERTNVHFEFNWFANVEQFQVNIASGDYYDIYWNFSANYTGGATKGYEEGIILDLTDYMQDYMPNYYAYLEEDGLALKAAKDKEGRLLAVYQLVTAPSITYSSTVVREDMLEKVGYTSDDLVTYENYYDAFYKIKVELGVKSPLYMFANGTTSSYQLAAGYGVSGRLNSEGSYMPWYQVGGEVRFGAVQPEYYEYLQMLQQWYADGLYDSDFLSHTNLRFLDDWDGVYQGNYAIYFQNSTIDEANKRGREFDPDFNMVVIPDAVKNKGDTLKLSGYGYTTIYTDFDAVISTQCEYPEILCKYMDYGYTDEGFIMFNYGREGESYEMVDGKPQFILEWVLDNPVVGEAGYQMVNFCCLSGNFARTETFLWTMFQTEEQQNARYVTLSNQETDDITKSYNILSAIQPDSAVILEFTNIMSEISTYANEWVSRFIMGDPQSDWDTYVANVEQMGLATGQKYMQEAYDEFMSR